MSTGPIRFLRGLLQIISAMDYIITSSNLAHKNRQGAANFEFWVLLWYNTLKTFSVLANRRSYLHEFVCAFSKI